MSKTAIFLYPFLVVLFMIIGMNTSGEIKMLFFGLEYGTLIGQIIYVLSI